MAADGAIVIETRIDDSEAIKNLHNLEKEIKAAEKMVSEQPDSGLSEAISAAKEKAVELENVLLDISKSEFGSGYSKEVLEFVENYAKKAQETSKATNEMQRELEKAKVTVETLESQGKWFGDEEYDQAVQKLERINADIEQYKKELITPAKPENPFGLDTISGKVREAEIELERLKTAGKGLGDEDYDKAYRSLALLKDEAKQYAAELAKTPAQAEREAASLEKAVQKAQEAAAKEAAAAAEAKRLREIADSAEVSDQNVVNLNKELGELKSRLADLKSAGVGEGYREFEEVSGRISEINNELKEYRANLTTAQERIEEAEESTKELADASDKAGRGFDKLLKRVSRLASRVFLFSMITSGLRSIRDWMGGVITSNDEASAALARLKGALLTMVQPLVSVVIPAFTTLVNLLTAIVGRIAAFISALGGKTVQQSADAAKALNKQANAIGGVGSAAKEAQKQLMGFDEINKLSSETSGGGGGGAGATDIQPDFSWADGISETLYRIADLVLLIGVGFALWKISDLLPDKLGDILGKLGLILAAIGFLLIAWDGIKNAWENGVDWGNMAEMILGVAGAAVALYLAFGGIAAGITLVVGGIALLIVAFHDMMENGMNLQNTLLAIAAIMMAGIGIGILTGSWIPILIASIASVLLSLVYFTGHGEELISGLKKVCSGFLDFFTGIFSGDMDKAFSGLKTMFSGLGEVGKAVLSGLQDAFWMFLSWLDDATGGVVTNVINMINSMISFIVDGINKLGSLLSSVSGGRIGWSITAPQIPQIPRLAQGAVIPPNREFMAVLGDQTRGNNIEAPEDLIRKIVREETAGNGDWDLNITFEGDLAQFIRYLEPKITAQQRKTNRAKGV